MMADDANGIRARVDRDVAEFPARAAAGAARLSDGSAQAARPSGDMLLLLGWLLLPAGLIAMTFGLIAPTFSEEGRAAIGELYPAVAPTINPWKPILTWGGASAAQLGFILLLAGWITRAIFFLPGRTVTKAELHK